MSARLSQASLAEAPPEVARPAYDRRGLAAGVVHLGLGAFHRAHQAFVFDRVLNAGCPGWGIVGVSIRSPSVTDALAPQDGLFSLLEREGEASALRIVGSIRRTLVAAKAPAKVERAIADPAVRLVTLTITEKGYDPGERLVWEILARALAARRAAGAPLTIASCDNLAANGARARGALLGAVGDPALADWIGAACAFPSSMVDRITPAATAADLGEVEARLGLRDEAAVVAEPFWQWVIEDRFAGPAPPLGEAGVQVVTDVAPFERAKLRLLNAAHSAMAYLGLMAGFRFVHEAFAWPPMRAFVGRLWDEAAATLAPTPGLDLGAYRAALGRRFANPSLAHRLGQIAEDGSRKLPQRVIASLGERARQGAPSPALTLALAAWIRCLGEADDQGRPFRMADPSLAAIRAALAEGAPPAEAMARVGMIAAADVLGGGAAESLAVAVRRLEAAGVRAALAPPAAGGRPTSSS